MTPEFWAPEIKRLRLIQSRTQGQFAEIMDVEQGTISRWERGRDVPDLEHQRQLRDMLHKLEANIPPSAIESMAGIALLYRTTEPGLLAASSVRAAHEHGSSAMEMRGRNIAKQWPDSVREMQELLMQSKAWHSGCVALVRAKAFRINGQWCDVTGLPINGAGLILWTATTAVALPNISPNHCQIEIFNKDEMIG